MADISKRPLTPKTIDLDCIKINVDGRTNSSKNPRCTDNNENKDGFVYTSSTYTVDDGKTYKYNYSINKNKPSGTYLESINGATDMCRNLTTIRDATKNNIDASESTINATKVWGGAAQFEGKATKELDFIYNEGSSTTLGNGKNDAQVFEVPTGDKDKDGNPKLKHASFYDTQTQAYSKQLIAVRQL